MILWVKEELQKRNNGNFQWNNEIIMLGEGGNNEITKMFVLELEEWNNTPIFFFNPLKLSTSVP